MRQKKDDNDDDDNDDDEEVEEKYEEQEVRQTRLACSTYRTEPEPKPEVEAEAEPQHKISYECTSRTWPLPLVRSLLAVYFSKVLLVFVPCPGTAFVVASLSHTIPPLCSLFRTHCIVT